MKASVHGFNMMSNVPSSLTSNCQLCDENVVNWKCEDCNEFMCNVCKKVHLKSKASSNHQVLSIDDSEEQQTGDSVQKEITKCDNHPSEDLQLYCEECKILICLNCVIDKSHHDHKLFKLEDIAVKKRKELSDITEETKLKLASYEDASEFIQKNTVEYTESLKEQTLKIKEWNEKMKSQIDNISEGFYQKLEQRKSEDLGKLEQIKNEKEEIVSELRKIQSKCEEIQTLSETGFIKAVDCLKSEVEKYRICGTMDSSNPPNFEPKDVNEQDLLEHCGNLHLEEEMASDYVQTEIETIKTKLVSSFQFRASAITRCNDNAYVACLGEKNFHLITSEGHIINTYPTDFHMGQMTVTDDGMLFLTVWESKKVKQLTKNGKFRDFYVAPRGCQVRGITETVNGNLVVCLLNKEIKYDHKIIELSLDGNINKTIQYDPDSHTPLFFNPYSVSCNRRNGDLIVAQPGHSVMAVGTDCHRKFIYKGLKHGFDKPFYPYYTAIDICGHIFVSDMNNSVIHLLNENGSCLQLILTEKEGILNPIGLCLDLLGRLWICNDGKSTINVVENLQK